MAPKQTPRAIARRQRKEQRRAHWDEQIEAVMARKRLNTARWKMQQARKETEGIAIAMREIGLAANLQMGWNAREGSVYSGTPSMRPDGGIRLSVTRWVYRFMEDMRRAEEMTTRS